jgi:hypothetical protein
VGPFAGLTVDMDQLMSASVFADDANTVEVADWGAGVTNIRATWTGHTGGLQLTPFASVQNLFDRSYIGSVTINGTFGRVFEPSPGRTPSLPMSKAPVALTDQLFGLKAVCPWNSSIETSARGEVRGRRFCSAPRTGITDTTSATSLAPTTGRRRSRENDAGKKIAHYSSSIDTS